MSAIAAFVTAHGFGHAARACAVIDAVTRMRPGIRVELFTNAPRWFFESSLRVGFRIHEVQGDVGLVQRNALDADLDASVSALDALLPLDDALVSDCADTVVRLGCRMVLVDIAPLGVAVGRRARVPTVLVENFTWDWIYRNLETPPARLLEHARTLDGVYAQADVRLRADPVCGGAAGRVVPVIRRRPREPVASVRRRLGLPSERPMVLVSMGGAGSAIAPLQRSTDQRSVIFVISGAHPSLRRTGSLVPLPARSEFFHPDLVAAADVVVGKLGYSTVAEAVGVGTPFAYIPRDGFPESPVLERFIGRHLASARIDRERFEAGDWSEAIDGLLDTGRTSPITVNADGAEVTAREVISLVDGRSPSWNPGDLRHSPVSS